MKIIDKFLLFLLLILTAAAALACILLETGILPLPGLSSLFAGTANAAPAIWIVIATAIALLAIDLRLFMAVFLTSGETTAASEVSKTPIEKTELGISYITVAALNAMAHKRCMAFRFVNECATSVSVVNEGIIVAVKIVPAADVKLPESMRELQQSLKASLEEQAGIKVKEIPVLILPQAAKKTRSETF